MGFLEMIVILFVMLVPLLFFMALAGVAWKSRYKIIGLPVFALIGIAIVLGFIAPVSYQQRVVPADEHGAFASRTGALKPVIPMPPSPPFNAVAKSERSMALADLPASASSESQIETPIATSNFEVPPTLPADAPEWVRTPPDRVGDDWAQLVVSDPLETGAECDRNIQEKARGILQVFVHEYIQAKGVDRSGPIQVSDAMVTAALKDRYSADRPTSLGAMRQAYRMVVFDDNLQRQVDEQIEQAAVQRRLWWTGMFSLGTLSFVSTLFGFLRTAARRSPDPLAPRSAMVGPVTAA